MSAGSRHLGLLLTGVLVVCPALAFAQWTMQSPRPTHLDVRGIGAPTAARVFIATSDDSFDDGGALWESTDGGLGWTQREVPFSLGDDLNGLFFLDTARGWAWGNRNYRTVDAGTTWQELPFLGSTYTMRFYTPTFGLGTGNFGQYVSRDGGLSWVPSPHDMVAFDFATISLGLGASASGVYRTVDGGATFTPVRGGAASAVVFLSTTTAVAIVDDSLVRSTDGGQTWTTGVTALGRTKLVAVADDVVLAWGRGGSWPDYDDRILRSADGGQTWTDLAEVMPAGVDAFTVLGPQAVVAADLAGNLYRSTDGGATFPQTFASPGPLPGYLSSAEPAFADQQTGYFGYGNGFVIKTTDGGATWRQISSGSGQALHDVARFPGGGLIAVGDGGTLLTSDGTSPWQLHPAPTTLPLVAVQVLDAQTALILDDDGRVYRSTDAGATWTAAAATPPNLDARDLHFFDLLDGWVAGSGFAQGAVFHTTDGGATWTPVPDVAGTYVAIDFAGASGWAANAGGRYYRTIDGGATWEPGDLEAGQLGDMEFWDQSTGYAVGLLGFVMRSDDGGATWQQLPLPPGEHDVTDIHLLGPNELWLSTSDDVVYYSATGGQNWAVLDIGSPGFGYFAAVAASPDGSAWAVGDQGRIAYFAGPPPPPLNRPPDASFTFVTAGLTVRLTDTSVDHDGTVVSWAWNFGDGATSTERHPTHTFDGADTYIVRLTVTDDDGAETTAARFIVAQPGPGGTFGDFTEVTPLDPLFVTPQDEDFWVTTTAPADYDGDGDLDIAVLGFYVVYNESAEDRLVLLRNDGTASSTEWEFAYVDVDFAGLSSGASDLAWADIDGDGDQDLAVGSNGDLVLYRNDAGALTRTDATLPGYWEDNDQADFDLRSLTFADYDNDGDQDLLVPSSIDAEEFRFRTHLLRNDGGFAFALADSAFAPTAHAQSAWADHDGDQDLDLLLVNIAPLFGDGFIRRYRNDGGGAFVGEDILGALTVEHGEAQWGDYDTDGDLDILIAGNIKEMDGTYTNALRIYRNDADVLTPLAVIDCLPCEGWFDLTAATWADYDSDGDMDILLAGTYNSGQQIEGRARIYRNEGGAFVESGTDLPAPRASGDRGGAFSWLDLDGDGDLDYFIAGQYFVPGGNGLVESQMHVYRNDAAQQNQAPSPPSGLVVDVQKSPGTVLLSWHPGADDRTPAAALTHHLELYRGGAPVAMPSPLPQPGSLGPVSRWSLAGLDDGHYTWTLRTVDSAYNSSAPASSSFTIGTTAIDTPPLPSAYSFGGAVPNPFNPSTTLRFALPEPSRVELTIFDLRGRVVARLLDEERAAGEHEARWDARAYASGAYVVRLSTPKFTESRNLTLLK